MEQKPDKSKLQDYLLLLPSLIPLIAVFLYPLIKGILLTFQDHGTQAWTAANYVRFFTDKAYYLTVFRTLKLVIPASLLEMIIAFAMAYHLRYAKRAGVLGSLIIFPLTLGPLIISVGMVGFFKPAGWLNRLLTATGLIHDSIHVLYNYWGTFISLLILGIAFIFSNMVGLMESIDPNLEQAARSLGASDITVFRRIFFPLIRAGTLSVLALNIVMQLAVFASAILVGNPASETRVMTVAAFDEAMRNFNYNMASTIAMVMAVIQIATLLLVFFIRKLGYVGSSTTFK